MDMLEYLDSETEYDSSEEETDIEIQSENSEEETVINEQWQKELYEKEKKIAKKLLENIYLNLDVESVDWSSEIYWDKVYDKYGFKIDIAMKKYHAYPYKCYQTCDSCQEMAMDDVLQEYTDKINSKYYPQIKCPSSEEESEYCEEDIIFDEQWQKQLDEKEKKIARKSLEEIYVNLKGASIDWSPEIYWEKVYENIGFKIDIALKRYHAYPFKCYLPCNDCQEMPMYHVIQEYTDEMNSKYC